MKFAYLIEPPFNHRSSDGSVTGTDVELARMIVNELQLGELELIETEFAELLPGVANGRWRMTTGLFATREREKLVSFSKPIWALPDGLLVPAGNPLGLSGYRSIASINTATLAVIRDQVQHASAIELGVPTDRLKIFETYTEAANAVLNGTVNAYASVARAHTGYLALDNEQRMQVITISGQEKQPAFGSFAFNNEDDVLRKSVDEVLKAYYGSKPHRMMMHQFGFDDAEIDLVLEAYI